jgi:tetratricopeptide (TPR) repeat protein
MGLFEFLFGPHVPKPSDPDELKRVVLLTVRSGDRRRLERLCRTNSESIRTHFPGWQKVPEQIRGDPAEVQQYVAGLVAIAQVFAEGLGHQELMQRLLGSPHNNPLVRWQDTLGKARQWMDGFRYAEAQSVLSDLLIDTHELGGSGADKYRPITLGYLGESYFQSGDAQKAVEPTTQALELCRDCGDTEGVLAYLGNLYEMHRYLGQQGAAADWAAQLADAFERQGRLDEARRYRRQEVLLREGEPLNRVVAVVDGQRYEVDEPGALSDHVQFFFERNRITLQPARALTTDGERSGNEGRFDEALATFESAAKADPFDPHCRYQAGLTLLHLGRYADAVASYETTEALAPGWFHCRADLWLAQQLTLGQVGHETWLKLQALEDGPMPPHEKVRLAERALTEAPRLAHLHLARGKNLALLGHPREARDAYREGLACEPEPDVRTRLLVDLGVLLEDTAERRALLGECQAIDGNLVAAATATIFLRKMTDPT